MFSRFTGWQGQFSVRRGLSLVVVWLLVVSWSQAASLKTEAVTNPLTGQAARAVAGELIVRFRPGVTATSVLSAHRAAGATVLASNARLGWQLVSCPTGKTLSATMAAYRGQTGVRDVSPNYVCKAFGTVHAKAVPNDPRYSALTAMPQISAPAAWNLQTGSASVVVAVIDSGIDRSHEDLAANVWTNSAEIAGNGVDDDGNGYIDDYYGWDFADSDNDPDTDDGSGSGEPHGTHVAGTIGAVGNNSLGVVGVNWTCRLMGVRVLNSAGEGDYWGVSQGIIYAADNGARVLNMSLGGTYSSSMQDAIDYAYAKGCVICCALGNEYAEITTSSSTWTSPACNDGVIGTDNKVLGVAAVNSSDVKADFSNYSSAYHFCDCSAPGVNILSTIWPSGYASYSGTSMATPHVAGLAALIAAEYPTATNAQIMRRIMSNADDIDSANSSYAGKLGSGRINAYASLGADVAGPATLAGTALDDDNSGGSVGDGDGVADPGETVQLSATFANEGALDLTGVVAQLTTTSDGVTLGTASVTVGTLAGGTTVTPSTPFVFSLASTIADNSDLNFKLSLTATNGGPYQAGFTLHVGRDSWGEPDNTPATALLVATDGTLASRRFESGSDEDWFAFNAQAGATYVLRTQALTTSSTTARASAVTTKAVKGQIGTAATDTYLELYSANGTTLLTYDDDSGGNLYSRLSWTASVAGKYYARVRPYNSASTGTYAFSITGNTTGTPGPLAYVSCSVDDSAGDADGVADPGETVQLTVTVGNSGTAAATGVSGTLSTTTSGVTVSTATASFGDIAAGANAAATDYVLTLGKDVTASAVACALNVTAGNCGPYDLSFSVPVGGGRPAVTAATPTASDASLGSRLRVTFSTDMHRVSVQNSFTLAPTAALTFGWSGRTLVVTPTTGLQPGTTYTATVGARSRSAAGVPLGSDYVWQFTTASHFVSVRVPAANATQVARNTPVDVAFAVPVNQTSATSHFSLQPVGGSPVAGTVTWLLANRKLRFTPTASLTAGALYTATLSAGIVRTDGTTLTGTESWSFTTTAGPAVTAWSPTGSSVAATSPLQITFDQAMHRVSVQTCFRTSPQLTGTFAWSGNRVTFQPTTSLTAGQAYRVTLKAAARSASGVRLNRDFSWTFTVANATAASGALTVSAVALPTAGGAQITVNLASAADVEVEVLNLAGRKVAGLSAGTLSAGTQALLWSGRSLTGTQVPSGSYLVRVSARGTSGAMAQTLTSLRLNR